MCSVKIWAQDEIKPNGHNVFYFADGSKASEGKFKNGLPEGLWKAYYQTGVLKSEGYKLSGLSDSLWTFYNEQEEITHTFVYANDMKNGCATLFDSIGNVSQEIYYVDDKRQGESVWFFEDGAIKKTLNFDNDKESGIGLEYNKDGIVIVEEEYNNGYLRNTKKFNQLDEEGNKTGVWREYFGNGEIKSETSYKGGLKDGLMKEFDKDGKLLTINEMENGQVASDPGGVVIIDLYKEYHSNGTVKLVGGRNKGKKSGIFRTYDEEGNLLRAYVYKMDTLLSEGMLKPGGIFEDEWITYYRDGTKKSNGTFNEGKRDGKWVYYYKGGQKEQEGKFREDVLSGQWVWYYQNGQIKKSEFFNRKGLLEGEQVEYDSLGNELSKGEYYNGKKEGAWFYQVGDYKEVGSFLGGSEDGQWNYFYSNGRVGFTGMYSDGEPKGKHYYYHQNGIKKLVGKYAGGVKHGVWRAYSERGEIEETIQYKTGVTFKINGFKINEFEEE
ncbi:MAG: antitoxin component YwqK of YwqJK toxin-antitoxin module [Arenicella sp.]|jgi:antitoxin component YwqK of YwqJK toxin-antitoxin module